MDIKTWLQYGVVSALIIRFIFDTKAPVSVWICTIACGPVTPAVFLLHTTVKTKRNRATDFLRPFFEKDI